MDAHNAIHRTNFTRSQSLFVNSHMKYRGEHSLLCRSNGADLSAGNEAVVGDGRGGLVLGLIAGDVDGGGAEVKLLGNTSVDRPVVVARVGQAGCDGNPGLLCIGPVEE